MLQNSLPVSIFQNTELALPVVTSIVPGTVAAVDVDVEVDVEVVAKTDLVLSPMRVLATVVGGIVVRVAHIKVLFSFGVCRYASSSFAPPMYLQLMPAHNSTKGDVLCLHSW